jgi:putative FmdB family regulatory protein
MPRYEYQCEACNEVMERQRSIAERNEPERCSCGAVGYLVPSLSGFTLNGPGWTPRGNTPAPPRTPRRRKGYDMTGDRD